MSKMTRNREGYQELFNEALSKIRIVLDVTKNERLMRSVAKIMFDFSDGLKKANLIKDEEPTNGTRTNNKQQ